MQVTSTLALPSFLSYRQRGCPCKQLRKLPCKNWTAWQVMAWLKRSCKGWKRYLKSESPSNSFICGQTLPSEQAAVQCIPQKWLATYTYLCLSLHSQTNLSLQGAKLELVEAIRFNTSMASTLCSYHALNGSWKAVLQDLQQVYISYLPYQLSCFLCCTKAALWRARQRYGLAITYFEAVSDIWVEMKDHCVGQHVHWMPKFLLRISAKTRYAFTALVMTAALFWHRSMTWRQTRSETVLLGSLKRRTALLVMFSQRHSHIFLACDCRAPEPMS